MRSRTVISFLLLAVPSIQYAFAGGPRLVGGPAVGTRAAFGIDGQPFTWNPAKMPVAYRLDPGPMAVNPSGTVVVDHNAGAQRVQSMFGVWQSVSTAKISFSNAGAILPAGSYTGGDLQTAQQYNDVIGSCNKGAQSPVIFDANGSLIASLGLPPEVIGFNVSCALDIVNGYILSSAVVLNGEFQDGINTSVNFELSNNQFDEAITHELGHFSGLDHSQINVDVLTNLVFPCEVDSLAGLPLMFPIALCQARKDAGLPVLSPDDIAWISTLYPRNLASDYATISGVIYFNDGASPMQGANVIARQIDDPGTPEDESRRVAVSVVSGYAYTSNPGQSVTATLGGTENNTNGSPLGSRNPALIGYYKLSVPPGTYTLEVEEIYNAFVGGSSVGPLDPPVALPGGPEFWNKDESAFDFPMQRDMITVTGGDSVTGINIILNDTNPRFDQYEDNGKLLDPPIPLLLSVVEEFAG
jgi:hypothetical protein